MRYVESELGAYTKAQNLRSFIVLGLGRAEQDFENLIWNCEGEERQSCFRKFVHLSQHYYSTACLGWNYCVTEEDLDVSPPKFTLTYTVLSPFGRGIVACTPRDARKHSSGSHAQAFENIIKKTRALHIALTFIVFDAISSCAYVTRENRW